MNSADRMMQALKAYVADVAASITLERFDAMRPDCMDFDSALQEATRKVGKTLVDIGNKMQETK